MTQETVSRKNENTADSPSVFGVPLDNVSLEELVKRIGLGHTTKPYWIVTANAEILLEAKHDSEYASVLRKADLRVIDGSGPQFMLRLSGNHVERLPGVDLAEALVRLAQQKQWRIGLFGGGPSVAKEAATCLRATHPGLNVAAEEGGVVARDGVDDVLSAEAREKLSLFDPSILFVALSFPGQERWIAKHRHEFQNARAIVGVGGTFDYWAGRKKRAPHMLRILGLEWFWRLIREPKRYRRIWNATVVFPLKYLMSNK